MLKTTKLFWKHDSQAEKWMARDVLSAVAENRINSGDLVRCYVCYVCLPQIEARGLDLRPTTIRQL